jgi:hypothetical protein
MARMLLIPVNIVKQDLPLEYWLTDDSRSGPGRTGNIREGGIPLYLPELRENFWNEKHINPRTALAATTPCPLELAENNPGTTEALGS